MKNVGIIGAGAIACGYAAFLEQAGHSVRLWSPRGNCASRRIKAEGAVETPCELRFIDSVGTLVDGADVLVLALPAFGHRAVLDALAPHIRPGQPVIISSHTAFGALYLGDLLTGKGVVAPIIAWSTTALTAKMPAQDVVRVGNLRARVDMSVLPEGQADAGLALCTSLFGERFLLRDDLLSIALSNLNPQNHLGIALCNATRMDKGEIWSQVGNMTPMVARLLEALDSERLAIAAGLGLSVRTVHEHFHLSYHVPQEAALADMFAEMQRRGLGGNGPATPSSRYVTEDVPFGLVPIILLGRLSGRQARLHQAGLDLISAMYGRDFAVECDLIEALRLDELSLDALRDAARAGTTRAVR
ncbi:NAD/NADP-dependent octopine/nopaline dehydrogenase family protein [Roseinatronobacter alkalisoli]|uniref:2-dehydropantoate 2-reductase n=1 Tax=Roseinatronobacter alkalisoli TaxID=3028235 RepID=A0ABT5TEN3_9RHOB|nr:NAD/NADP-dependent octopine/nopaline dehydrogenase family protein [Roseinatronobacter sp. HJB301]MDD7972363.1 NAD/NADP octopine/nopaline dehydrogenase family protein [Roseinatronobacter sp. HJB301]